MTILNPAYPITVVSMRVFFPFLLVLVCLYGWRCVWGYAFVDISVCVCVSLCLYLCVWMSVYLCVYYMCVRVHVSVVVVVLGRV